MITVWYLVIFFVGTYGRGVDHVPFETQQECLQAEKDIQQQAGGNVDYACVKGVMR